jgi:hypothetical protein
VKDDIRIYLQVEAGTTSYPIAAAQSFEPGEVVLVQAAGTLAEAADDPASVAGITMGSSQGKDTNGDEGTVPTGTSIPIYKPGNGQLFITQNFATDGAGTLVTPTQAHVGDTAGFTLSSGVWLVDTGAANAHVEVVAVLDGNGQPVGDGTVRSAGTGVSVVFGFSQP